MPRPARFWRTSVADEIASYSLAVSTVAAVPDTDRRVIYEFATHSTRTRDVQLGKLNLD